MPGRRNKYVTIKRWGCLGVGVSFSINKIIITYKLYDPQRLPAVLSKEFKENLVRPFRDDVHVKGLDTAPAGSTDTILLWARWRLQAFFHPQGPQGIATGAVADQATDGRHFLAGRSCRRGRFAFLEAAVDPQDWKSFEPQDLRGLTTEDARWLTRHLPYTRITKSGEEAIYLESEYTVYNAFAILNEALEAFDFQTWHWCSDGRNCRW